MVYGQYIGKQHATRYIWWACKDCHEERWIPYIVREKRPTTEYCRKCSSPTIVHNLCDLSSPRKIGDFTLGEYIGKHPWTRYIWWACQDCGEERWVKYIVKKKEVESPRCFHCSKIGMNNHFYGKHHTDEAKRKINENDPGRRGQKNSPEHRAKQSISIKKAFENPDLIAKIKALPHNQKGTPEYDSKRANISIGNKGKKRTPEMIAAWRKRMDAWVAIHGHSASGHNWTAEQRAHLSRVHKGLQAKEKHPRWMGGISFEEYGLEWTMEVKNRIKERDGFTCQLCFRNKEQVTLAVHHIDYNKKHNEPINHITLCRSCNAKVNMNRDFWTVHFQALMKVKYGNRYKG